MKPPPLFPAMPPEQPERQRWIWSGGCLRVQGTGEIVVEASGQDSWLCCRSAEDEILIAAAPEMLEALEDVEERGLKALPEVRALLSRLRGAR